MRTTTIGWILALTVGGCAGQHEEEQSPLLDRTMVAEEGTTVVATLELEGPPVQVGGGLAMIFGQDGDEASSLDPVYFYVVDPATLPLDAYADIDHELHVMSTPLTDEQVGMISTATQTGAALNIVTDSPIRTYGDGQTALVRVAVIDAVTDEFVPAATLPVRFLAQ